MLFPPACKRLSGALEGLSQAYKNLSSLDTGNWTEISANIDSYWPDGGLVSQAESYRVAVIVEEVAKADAVVHVTAVIEEHTAQTALEGNGKPCFRIDDEELVASYWHTNRGAC